jgi:hypothetical protein
MIFMDLFLQEWGFREFKKENSFEFKTNKRKRKEVL